MAINVDTFWEVRPATGSDTNGGAFVSGATGTDYSQQDSPQVTYTDLAIDATTNTKLTSAGTPFTSAHVGNTINITSGTGFTTGRYQVVSVAANVATMDRAVGTTSSTGGNGKLGGALATMATAWAAGVQSNTYYLKGTLTVTAALVMSRAVSSSDKGPNRIIGYGSTRGDGTRATWTTATNSVDLIQFGSAIGYLFQNIEFSSTAGTPGNGLNANTTATSGGIVVDNCLVHGFAVGLLGDWQTSWSFGSLIVYRSRIYSCTSHGIFNNGATLVLASYIHNNGGDGYHQGTNNSSPAGLSVFWRSVIKSNSGKGIANSQQDAITLQPRFQVILECDILNNTGDNVNISGGTPGGFVALNSIIDGAGGFGINFTRSFFAFQVLGAIAWRSNSSGDVSGVTKSPSDVTLTGDPFTNRASDDFTLNGTAGAGAACKSIGQPTTFPP